MGLFGLCGSVGEWACGRRVGVCGCVVVRGWTCACVHVGVWRFYGQV